MACIQWAACEPVVLAASRRRTDPTNGVVPRQKRRTQIAPGSSPASMVSAVILMALALISKGWGLDIDDDGVSISVLMYVFYARWVQVPVSAERHLLTSFLTTKNTFNPKVPKQIANSSISLHLINVP